MGLITGYLCLVFMLLLMMKFVSRKCHFVRINRFLTKSHKFIAFSFLSIGVIHFFLVLPVFKTRMKVIPVSGIATVVIGFALVIVCHLIKDKRKELFLHRTFSVIIAVMAIIHVVFYFNDYNNYLRRINDISIAEVDLSAISDGIYTGEYDAGFVYARVKVTVKNHVIEDVEILEHRTERGQIAEVIADSIVEKQKVEVDCISSATNSSKVIKKATENALRGK